MNKREKLIRNHKKDILDSMRIVPGALPAGIDSNMAVRRPASLEGVTKEKNFARIEVDRIVRDETQPRTGFDQGELDRLAASLKSKGQLQPIRVRWDEGRGLYVIVVGDRRWRAAKLAGLSTLNCLIVEEDLSEGERLSIRLVENFLREDLGPIDQAKAFKTLMERNGFSQHQLAEFLAISQSTIARSLALLSLDPAVQDQVNAGKIATYTASEIAKIPDRATQVELAEATVSEGLKGSDVSEMVQTLRKRRGSNKAVVQAPISMDIDVGVITIRWKKAGAGLSTVQMLKRALKTAQDLELAQKDDAAYSWP